MQQSPINSKKEGLPYIKEDSGMTFFSMKNHEKLIKKKEVSDIHKRSRCIIL